MKFIIILATLALSSSVSALESQPKLVSVPLSTAYIPQGFDSNDKAQFVVEGVLPNSCYRIGPSQIKVNPDTKKIEIEQKAYLYSGMCLQMIIPYHLVIQAGILTEGRYRLLDVKSGQILGDLPIKMTLFSEPDDYLYASVRDAFVFRDEFGNNIARIEGFFSDTCSRMKEIRSIVESDRVVTLLPIVEKVEGLPCQRRLVPFTEQITLPSIKGGRHLLHVRSLNGQAVNKLFDVTGGGDS